jgi:hypothetical protein
MMSSDHTSEIFKLVLTSHFVMQDRSLVALSTLFRYFRVSHKLRDFINRTPQLFRHVVLSHGIRYETFQWWKGAVQWLLGRCAGETQTLVVRNLPCNSQIAVDLQFRFPNLTRLTLSETVNCRGDWNTRSSNACANRLLASVVTVGDEPIKFPKLVHLKLVPAVPDPPRESP